MDLSHAAFLHPDTVGNEAVGRGSMTVKEIDGGLQVNNWYPNGNPSPALAASGAAPADSIVDFWNDVRWLAPGALWLDSGVTPTGRPRSEGSIFSSSQFLTPETAGSTHYFWQVYRSYNLGQPAITQAIVDAVHYTFAHEDEPMIAAVQKRMAGREFWSLKPVLLQTDAAAVKARRLMAQLRSAEA